MKEYSGLSVNRFHKLRNIFKISILGLSTAVSMSHANTSQEEPVLGSLKFDGVDDYAVVNNINNLDFAREVTIEAWVKAGDTQRWGRIFDFSKDNTKDAVFLATSEDMTGVPMFCAHYEDLSRNCVRASSQLPINEWAHVAVTLKRNVQDNVTIGKIYIDGKLEGTNESMRPPQNIVRTNNYLGKSSWEGDEYFQGEIRNLRFWNYQRTNSNINANANTVYSSALYRRLMSNYEMNVGDAENSRLLNHTNFQSDVDLFGPVINQISEQNPHLFNNSEERLTVEAGSLVLDGVDDYAEFTNLNDFNVGGDFSIEAWVKPEEVKRYSRIVEFATYPTLDAVYLSASKEDSGKPMFCIHHNYSLPPSCLNSMVKLPLDEWSHVAVTFDKTSADKGIGKLYVNGDLQHVNYSMEAPVHKSLTQEFPSKNWSISKSRWASDEYFKGEIRNFRFWNAARTEANIQDNMNTVYAAHTPELVSNYRFNTLDEADSLVVNHANQQSELKLHGASVTTLGQREPMLPKNNFHSASNSGYTVHLASPNADDQYLIASAGPRKFYFSEFGSNAKMLTLTNLSHAGQPIKNGDEVRLHYDVDNLVPWMQEALFQSRYSNSTQRVFGGRVFIERQACVNGCEGRDDTILSGDTVKLISAESNYDYTSLPSLTLFNYNQEPIETPEESDVFSLNFCDVKEVDGWEVSAYVDKRTKNEDYQCDFDSILDKQLFKWQQDGKTYAQFKDSAITSSSWICSPSEASDQKVRAVCQNQVNDDIAYLTAYNTETYNGSFVNYPIKALADILTTPSYKNGLFSAIKLAKILGQSNITYKGNNLPITDDLIGNLELLHSTLQEMQNFTSNEAVMTHHLMMQSWDSLRVTLNFIGEAKKELEQFQRDVEAEIDRVQADTERFIRSQTRTCNIFMCVPATLLPSLNYKNDDVEPDPYCDSEFMQIVSVTGADACSSAVLSSGETVFWLGNWFQGGFYRSGYRALLTTRCTTYLQFRCGID